MGNCQSEQTTASVVDTNALVNEVGGSKRPVTANPALLEHIKEKRKEIRTTEEKLRNSLTTTIVDGGKEERVMYNENWFRKERDNLSKKYPTLPPIESGKVVTQTGTAFIL